MEQSLQTAYPSFISDPSASVQASGGGAAGGVSDALTLLELWKMVRRRRWVIVSIVVLLIAAAIMMSIFSTRRYQATGEIQVQKDSSDALGLDEMMGGAAGATDALDANITLQTQAKILESQTLGLEVVDALHMTETSDFQSHFSVLGWMLGVLSPKGVADPKSATLEGSPKKRDHAFSVFKANTKIAPVAGTRLIEVSYTSSDPKLASAAVNSLIQSLIDYNFQTRYTATSQASEWLGKQLSDLRGDSEQLQRRVADLQRDSGVFTFGGEDIQGKGIAYSTILDQLQQATTNLTQAQSNRVIRGALYEAAKSGDPEMMASLSGSSLMSGASPAVGTSITLIQTLRTQEATQKAAISEALAKFGSAYPKLEEMRANLASVEESIRAEQGRLLKQTGSDYVVAQQVEERMRGIFEEQKKGAEAMNNKAIQYALVRQEAEESRGLYERLLSRLKEAGVLEGLKSSNITIVEPGRVPSKPAKPNVKLLLLAAVAGGLLLGLGTAFCMEAMDSKVRDMQVLSGRFGDSLFGELPYERMPPAAARASGDAPASRLFTVVDPASAYSEELRGLRTAILLARGGAPPKVILVTSSISGEGKSTLAANLATLLAQQGKRVLVMDADLRRPILHTIFGLENTAGLSNLLTNEVAAQRVFDSIRQVEGIAGLNLLTAGQIPPYPSELLGSEQMASLIEQLRERFDFIVMDGAPILPVTDSVVFAPLADQILLLARHGVTDRGLLEKSFRLLHARTPGTSIGVVVNAIKRSSEAYAYSYGYGYGRHNYGKGTV
jgi:capsular exopolysaccharide synthesis family protein